MDIMSLEINATKSASRPQVISPQDVVRSRSDGMYRYLVMAGMREFVWSEHKSLSYTKEDFGDFTKWGGFTISELTRLFLFEGKPYLESEKGTFDAQMGLRMKRKTPDAYIEGDSLDVS